MSRRRELAVSLVSYAVISAGAIATAWCVAGGVISANRRAGDLELRVQVLEHDVDVLKMDAIARKKGK